MTCADGPHGGVPVGLQCLHILGGRAKAAVLIVPDNDNSRGMSGKGGVNIGQSADLEFGSLVRREFGCNPPPKVVFETRIGLSFRRKNITGPETGDFFIRCGQLVNGAGNGAHSG